MSKFIIISADIKYCVGSREDEYIVDKQLLKSHGNDPEEFKEKESLEGLISTSGSSNYCRTLIRSHFNPLHFDTRDTALDWIKNNLSFNEIERYKLLIVSIESSITVSKKMEVG